MPIRIKLIGGETLSVRADPSDWAKAYKRALDNNSMIEVHDADRTLAINPRQVLYWEEGTEQDLVQTARQHQPA